MKKRILVISPHPDDETLGLGGTISKHIFDGDDVFILTISGHLPPLYNREDYEETVKEAKNAFEILGVQNSHFLEIPATMIGDEPISSLNMKISKYGVYSLFLENILLEYKLFFVPQMLT